MQIRLENKLIYGGFFVRAAAYLVDLVLSGIIASIIKFPFWIAAMGNNAFLTKEILFQYTIRDITTYLLGAAYFILLTYFMHTTPGKILFQLKVITVKENWSFLDIAYRETIGRFLSGLCFIGYIVAGLDRERRGFHDMLSDTRVVYKHVKKMEPPSELSPES